MKQAYKKAGNKKHCRRSISKQTNKGVAYKAMTAYLRTSFIEGDAILPLSISFKL